MKKVRLKLHHNSGQFGFISVVLLNKSDVMAGMKNSPRQHDDETSTKVVKRNHSLYLFSAPNSRYCNWMESGRVPNR